MMYLLDTHVVLWAAENSPLLSEKAKTAILDEKAEKFVSIVSAWEVAIKLGNHKLNLDGGLSEFFRMVDVNGFIMLPVEREYLHLLAALPDYHKDPFDRLIVSTALYENLLLVSCDDNIHKYSADCLW